MNFSGHMKEDMHAFHLPPSDVPMLEAPIHVLLVEDYDLVRQGLTLLLSRYPDISIVGSASTRAEALEKTRQHRPDIILLDLMLGVESTLEILPDLLELGAGNVIVFTGRTDSEIHQNALALGAKAIVEKGQSEAQLADCIRRVHSGEIMQFEPESVKISRLSKMERDVVALLCSGEREEQVASQSGVSVLELRHILRQIQAKLEVSNQAELAVYAYRHGLAKIDVA